MQAPDRQTALELDGADGKIDGRYFGQRITIEPYVPGAASSLSPAGLRRRHPLLRQKPLQGRRRQPQQPLPHGSGAGDGARDALVCGGDGGARAPLVGGSAGAPRRSGWLIICAPGCRRRVVRLQHRDSGALQARGHVEKALHGAPRHAAQLSALHGDLGEGGLRGRGGMFGGAGGAFGAVARVSGPMPSPAPEVVRQAVGGGCRSGWGRLLSVTNAVEAGTWRQGDSRWA